MPRAPRIHYPGAVYHVMARGVDGREIFQDDYDRERFLRIAELAKRQSGAVLFAYCLMGNHFHFAVKVGQIPLSMFMQKILTSHAMSFNRRHARNGHLFQARYKAVLCLNDSYLASLIRYIHLNPVRASLVPKPDLWKWSSYREYENKGRSGLVNHFSDLPDLDSLESPSDFAPWPKIETVAAGALIRMPPSQRPTLEHLAMLATNSTTVTVDSLRSGTRIRKVTRIKNRLAHAAIENGYTFTEISRWLGISESSIRCYFNTNNRDNRGPDPVR